MARHGSMAEQLARFGKSLPQAANDNRRKPREPHYRGTLPALRWLWDNRPDLAPALADALPRPATSWFQDVEPSRQEIRPTVGELMDASHNEDGPCELKAERHGLSCHIELGRLKFRNGALVEWGVTKKGKKLKPTDRARSTEDKTIKTRSPALYLATKATTKSPMEASHYHRPMSDEPAIASMYDPLPGVEAGRALLVSLGVDGATPVATITHAVTFGAVVPLDGAGFLGGVSSPSGNSSEGAVMWEAPEYRNGDASAVIEEVAARGTLKSIGIRLGYSEANAIAAGKQALIEMAEIMTSIKDRKKSMAA